MVTFKGFIRELDRVQKQAERQRLRDYKQSLKEQELDSARQQFEQYTNHLEYITSFHKRILEPINWTAIHNRPLPKKPILSDKYQKEAKHRLANYTPSWWKRLFRLQDKKVSRMKQNIQEAPAKDKALFDEQMALYQQAYADWFKMSTLSDRLLKGDISAYQQVFEKFCKPKFKDNLGNSFVMGEYYQKYIQLNITVGDITTVPAYSLSLTSTGKLSRKNMSISRRFEIYQDYLCSCALCVVGSVFAKIPVGYILANLVVKSLNSITGHIEPQTFLSAWIPRQTFDSLNLNCIDPSDCMQNFMCNMKFSKTKGFMPVDPVRPPDCLK
ncbi:hypothetical protein [Candidatus Avelusimicrobium sp.]|uniref:hypothetical protein n=1 Tax=Candidatus Avelusimicrobium sp. TaxID=3048833 RepID=UPI003D7D002B